MLKTVAFCSIALTSGLDNGLGRTPQMGYSSWNHQSSQVNEKDTKAIAQYLVDSGLAALGYNHVNVDEGYIIGRDDKTGTLVEDRHAFPAGMKALGDWIHDLDVPGHGRVMKYGLYTSRGRGECARPEYIERCKKFHPGLNGMGCMGVGAQDHEEADAQWFVAQGADYLKLDSCLAPQDKLSAIGQYAKMRDALNATDRPVFFSLCGWHTWYAPPDKSIGYAGGASLGNSWRIYGDGKTWAALSGAVNSMAQVAQYAGPGGWNDPDLLIGPNCYIQDSQCGQTDLQARTQFSLWSLFPAPLLISQNMLNWSSYALETYSNKEAIAINQDKRGIAARRLFGNDLSFPCTVSDSNKECVNVWGRSPLADGSAAIVMVNNAAEDANVTCDTDCFQKITLEAPAYAVRDVWTQSQVAVIHKKNTGLSFSASVPGKGGSRYFKLTKLTEVLLV